MLFIYYRHQELDQVINLVTLALDGYEESYTVFVIVGRVYRSYLPPGVDWVVQ